MKKTITTSFVSLLLGVGIGYSIWSLSAPKANNSHTPNATTGTMSDTMSNITSDLDGKTGDTFDKEFLTEMITHHQGAVDMAHRVLTTSKRPELINLANEIILAQTKEITMMQEWQRNWFK